MSDRRRALPSWMEQKEKVKGKKPLGRRKHQVARSVFYCMNERELVEAAVAYLTNGRCQDVVFPIDQKVNEKPENTAVKIMEKPTSSKSEQEPLAEESSSSDCSDAQELTYISETDVDITEVETVPYTKSQEHQGPGGERSGPVQDHMTIELEADKKDERSQTPVEEDDDLRLVREIFFT